MVNPTGTTNLGRNEYPQIGIIGFKDDGSRHFTAIEKNQTGSDP